MGRGGVPAPSHQDSAPFEFPCKIDPARRTGPPIRSHGDSTQGRAAGAVHGLEAAGRGLQTSRDRQLTGLKAPSRRDDSRGATPARGGDERVKTRTAPRPNRASVPLGSLPSTAKAAPAPRATARRGRKTLPRWRMDRTAGVHHGSAKMCIGPPCRFHTPVRHRGVRFPMGTGPPRAASSPTSRSGASVLVPPAVAHASQARCCASRRPASRRTRRGPGHRP